MYLYGSIGLPALVVSAVVSAWLAEDGRGQEGSVPEALIAAAAFIVGGSFVTTVYAKQQEPVSEEHRGHLSDLVNFAGANAIYTVMGIGLAVMHMADASLVMWNGFSMVGVAAYVVLGTSLVGVARIIYKLAGLPGLAPRE